MTCRIAAMLLACLEDLHVDYVAFRATPAGKIALITLAGQACLEGVALYIRGPGRRRPQLEVVP